MTILSTPLPYFLIIIMSIVITPDQISGALPIGLSEEKALSYLEEIADEIKFVTRETEALKVPVYHWKEAEVGHYAALVENARSRWWLPSFGGLLRIRVGISADRTVTQVDITGARVGFP